MTSSTTFSSFYGLMAPTAKRDRSQLEVGDLVTVLVVKDGGFVESGARIREINYKAGYVHVTLAGLVVPQPYDIGMPLTLDLNKVIDWD